jgi:hypothetical protein
MAERAVRTKLVTSEACFELQCLKLSDSILQERIIFQLDVMSVVDQT